MSQDAAEVEFPYSAEYARTDKSKCGNCKKCISKGSMRMSIRTKSKFFDGYSDIWYHFDCFWTSLEERDINEITIKGFPYLTPEDQEQTRCQLNRHMTALLPPYLAPENQFPAHMNFCEPPPALNPYQEMMPNNFNVLFDQSPMALFPQEQQQQPQQQQQWPMAMAYPMQNALWNNAPTLMQPPFNHIVQPISLEKPPSDDDEISVVRVLRKRAGGYDVEEEEKLEDVKKEKPEMSLEEKLQRQFHLFCYLRNGFNMFVTEHQMKELLRINNQDIPDNREVLLDRLSDYALFGRPIRCPKCPQGQFVYDETKLTYVCTGHMSAWTKCTYTHMNPKRSPMGIPKSMADAVPWFLDAPFNALETRTYAEVFEELPTTSKSRDVLEDGYRGTSTTKGVTKSYIKSGTAVDADFEYAADAHVYKDEEGTLFTVSLSSTDMSTNKNSYYKVQLLKMDTCERYYIFHNWGRVGTSLGGNKTDTFKNAGKAKKQFEQIFLEKTGNKWADRKYFMKKPGMMYLMETDYSDIVDQGPVAPGSISQLPGPIIQILMMIFDVENMKKALRDYEIDTDKMPLGKLSRNQIMRAYNVLLQLQKLIFDAVPDNDKILDATNSFYTLIPHNFGMRAPEKLDTANSIMEKSRMLDSLMEIEFAYGVMRQHNVKDRQRDPVDVHYEKLNCFMEVLPMNSEEYRIIEEYCYNTHGETHGFKLEIMDILRLERRGERQKFKTYIGNRMLLWHGSGKSNYGGILSQGLRIAPPEAPSTGYMFGKGVYFADMASKSANYCRVTGNQEEGLLLLSDVALGNVHQELGAATHTLQSISARNCHSCMGVGSTAPDPSNYYYLNNEVYVPKGRAIQRGPGINTSLVYNEYIVYDVDQIHLRYMIRARFHYT